MACACIYVFAFDPSYLLWFLTGFPPVTRVSCLLPLEWLKMPRWVKPLDPPQPSLTWPSGVQTKHKLWIQSVFLFD